MGAEIPSQDPSAAALMRRDSMQITQAVLLSLLVFLPAGCTAHPPRLSAAAAPPTLQGDPAHPDTTRGWVDTQLYFGLGPANDPHKGISETDWRTFLDREVTPRFPSGLSVVDVYGQWQGKNQATPERLRSKMLVIDYPDTQENRDKIEAIRVAWKQKTGDQSVMRVTHRVDVSF